MAEQADALDEGRRRRDATTPEESGVCADPFPLVFWGNPVEIRGKGNIHVGGGGMRVGVCSVPTCPRGSRLNRHGLTLALRGPPPG